MATKASGTSGNATIDTVAYMNCDDVLLFWRVTVGGEVHGTIEGCRGFTITRRRKGADGSWGQEEILRNRTGFAGDHDDDAPDDDMTHMPSQPCTIWPFQCFDWTDHGAGNGEIVQYRIAAVALPEGGELGTTPMEIVADGGWTDPIAVSADAGEGCSAFFNRGAVMSQYITRIARVNNWSPRDIKAHIKELEEPLRRFLSGELRLALLALLDEVINDPALEFFAALYELSDQELIDRLKLLRRRAHIVLSNGSDKTGDGNEDARADLEAANVDVHDRLLASKGLGHNKFAVVVRSTGSVPVTAWTGSTNWAATGLCTQLNNGIRIDDRQVAQLYLDQWNRLADAGSAFPAALVQANAQSPRTVGSIDVWFSRVRNKSKKNTDLGSDLQALRDLVANAQEAIVYVMFQPGPEPLATMVARASEIYVRGVVSTVTPQNEELFAVDSKPYKTAVVQPEGIVKNFSWWAKEVTRAQFLYPPQAPGIGHAITHAKMIVIDPHLPTCAVITGSHNFSASASEQNDENFVVVRGNTRLAEAYAVACLATYRHYRWRAYVKDMFDSGKKPWEGLSKDPAWQSAYLTPARRRHLEMWCR